MMDAIKVSFKTMLLCVLFVVVAGVAAERNGNITTMEDLEKSDPLTSRIINGNDATQGQFPWQVSVTFYTENEIRYCGGSLIYRNWVLTAAHCALGASWFVLKFGGLTLAASEPGRVYALATRYHIHPGYDANTLNNDIALIQIERPVNLGSSIRTIRLPACGERTGVSEKVTVSGWGKTSDASTDWSFKLKYANLTTISNRECTNMYGSNVIKSSTLCCSGSNGKSTCNGDGGGPLVKIDASGATQVGIVSFVHRSGCSSGNPSGYIRTESYLNWIYQIIGVDSTNC